MTGFEGERREAPQASRESAEVRLLTESEPIKRGKKRLTDVRLKEE